MINSDIFRDLNISDLTHAIDQLNDIHTQIIDIIDELGEGLDIDLSSYQTMISNTSQNVANIIEQYKQQGAVDLSVIDTASKSLEQVYSTIRNSLFEFTNIPELVPLVEALQNFLLNETNEKLILVLNTTRNRLSNIKNKRSVVDQTVQEVYGPGASSVIIDIIKSFNSEIKKHGDNLKNATIHSDTSKTINAQILLNRLEKLQSKQNFLASNVYNLYITVSKQANIAQNMAGLTASATTDEIAMLKLIQGIRALHNKLQLTDKMLLSAESPYTETNQQNEPAFMAARVIQGALDEIQKSTERAARQMINIISKSTDYDRFRIMSEEDINAEIQRRSLRNIKLQQPLSANTDELINTLSGNFSNETFSYETLTKVNSARRLRTVLSVDSPSSKRTNKTDARLQGDMIRLTKLEIKSAESTVDIAKNLVVDLKSIKYDPQRADMVKAMRDDVLKQMRTLAGLIHGSVNIDPDNEDIKKLRVLREELADVAEELAENNNQKTVKTLADNFLSGMGGVFGIFNFGLGLMGLGNLLDVAEYARGGFSTDVQFGNVMYDTALANASYGVDFSRNVADMQLARGRELFNKTHGVISPTKILEIRNNLLRNNWRRGIPAEQAVAEADELANMLVSTSMIADTDLSAIASDLIYNGDMMPQEAVLQIHKAIDAARAAGIPLNKYFATINGLIPRMRELGVAANEFTGSVNALILSGMRIEDATALIETSARVRNNLFGGGGLGSNGATIVFGSMLGLNNDRPWVNALIGMISHTAEGAPIQGRHAYLGRILKQRYAFYLNATGSDNAGIANFNRQLRTDGFTGKQASTLTTILMNNDIDDERLGIVFEGFEGETVQDKIDLTERIKEMDALLTKASNELSATTKIQSYQKKLMQDIADLIEHDLAPMFTSINDSINDVLLNKLGPVVEWAAKYAKLILTKETDEEEPISQDKTTSTTDTINTTDITNNQDNIHLLNLPRKFYGDDYSDEEEENNLILEEDIDLNQLTEDDENALMKTFASLSITGIASILMSKIANINLIKNASAVMPTKTSLLRSVIKHPYLALASGGLVAASMFMNNEKEEDTAAAKKVTKQKKDNAAYRAAVIEANKEYESLMSNTLRKNEKELKDKINKTEKDLLSVYTQLGGDQKELDTKQRAVIKMMADLLAKQLISKNKAYRQVQQLVNEQVAFVKINDDQEVYIDQDTRTELWSEAYTQIYDDENKNDHRIMIANKAAEAIISRNLEEDGDIEWLRNYRLIAGYLSQDEDYENLLTDYAERDVANDWSPVEAMSREQFELAEEYGDDAIEPGVMLEVLAQSNISKEQKIALRKQQLRDHAQKLANDKKMLDVLVQKNYERLRTEYAKKQTTALTVNKDLGTGSGAYGNIPYLEWKQYIDASATKYGIDKRLLAAVIQTESSWDPNAVSYVGARGLTQVMPDTAAEHGVSADQMFDPATAIDTGAWYLRRVADTLDTNDPALIAAGYNAGPGAVQQYNGIPNYEETKNYVKKVLAAIGNPSEDFEFNEFNKLPPSLPQFKDKPTTPYEERKNNGSLAERIAKAADRFGGIVAQGKLIDNMWVKPVDINQIPQNTTRLEIRSDAQVENYAAQWAAEQRRNEEIIAAYDRANADQAATAATSIFNQEQNSLATNDVTDAIQEAEQDNTLTVTIGSTLDETQLASASKEIAKRLAQLQGMNDVNIDFVEKEAS